MVDAGKKLADVELQDVLKAARVAVEPQHRRVRALARPAGVGIKDHGAVEDRHDDRAQGVLDHPGRGKARR